MQLALAMAFVLMGSVLVVLVSLGTLATYHLYLASTVVAPMEVVLLEAVIQNAIVMMAGLASIARSSWRSARVIVVAMVHVLTVFAHALHHLRERTARRQVQSWQALSQRSTLRRSMSPWLAL